MNKSVMSIMNNNVMVMVNYCRICNKEIADDEELCEDCKKRQNEEEASTLLWNEAGLPLWG